MINLLPPEEKQILSQGYTERLVTILGSTALFFLICLLFVLLSIYFFLAGEADSQSFLLQQAFLEQQSEDFNGLKEAILKYNDTLPKILSFYDKEKHFTGALRTVYAISRPDGLSFSNLSLDGEKSSGDEKIIFVSISGKSLTREGLINYKDSIAKEASIKNVVFSPESWINSKNINFNVTFDLIEK